MDIRSAPKCSLRSPAERSTKWQWHGLPGGLFIMCVGEHMFVLLSSFIQVHVGTCWYMLVVYSVTFLQYFPTINVEFEHLKRIVKADPIHISRCSMINGHDSGTDLLEAPIPYMFKAQFSGLNFREYPNKTDALTNVPPFQDPEIPIDMMNLSIGFRQSNMPPLHVAPPCFRAGWLQMPQHAADLIIFLSIDVTTLAIT